MAQVLSAHNVVPASLVLLKLNEEPQRETTIRLETPSERTLLEPFFLLEGPSGQHVFAYFDQSKSDQMTAVFTEVMATTADDVRRAKTGELFIVLEHVPPFNRDGVIALGLPTKVAPRVGAKVQLNPVDSIRTDATVHHVHTCGDMSFLLLQVDVAPVLALRWSDEQWPNCPVLEVTGLPEILDNEGGFMEVFLMGKTGLYFMEECDIIVEESETRHRHQATVEETAMEWGDYLILRVTLKRDDDVAG